MNKAVALQNRKLMESIDTMEKNWSKWIGRKKNLCN